MRADNGYYLARCTNCWTQGATGGNDSAFALPTTPQNSAALWTPLDVGNGKWALKGDNGKYLSRCKYCVQGYTAIPDFAFINVDNAMNTSSAQWTVQNVFFFPLGLVNIQSDNGNYLARCRGCGPGNFSDSASVYIKAPVLWTLWTA